MTIPKFRDSIIDLVMENDDIDHHERFALREAITSWALYDTAEGRASLPPDIAFIARCTKGTRVLTEDAS